MSGCREGTKRAPATNRINDLALFQPQVLCRVCCKIFRCIFNGSGVLSAAPRDTLATCYASDHASKRPTKNATATSPTADDQPPSRARTPSRLRSRRLHRDGHAGQRDRPRSRLRTLTQWRDKHAAPNGPPRVHVHTACGHDAHPELPCADCGQRLAARELKVRPGPAANPTQRAEPLLPVDP